jgi:VanZ family protein
VTGSTRNLPHLEPRDLAVRRLSLWLLGSWALLVASASLYPFDGELRRLLDAIMSGLPQLQEWRTPSRRDATVNLLLYLPFGLLGAIALEKTASLPRRILWPIAGAGVLSLLIEIIQHALPARDPSTADWVLNLISAATGAVLGVIYSALPVRPFSYRLQRLAIGPAPALLVALWLIAHLAPFVPRLRPGRVEAAIDSSLSMPLSLPHLLGFFACYLVLGALANALLRRPFFWSGLLILFGVSIGGRLLFVGQHLSPAEGLALGAALALIGVLRRYDPRHWDSRLFLPACASLLAAGLWPVAAAATGSAATIWLPFAELADGPTDPGTLPLPERLFLGIGLAWLALRAGTRRVPPLPLAIAIAIVAEFLQQWIPGRIPDTTDVAALLIGAALAQSALPVDPRRLAPRRQR